MATIYICDRCKEKVPLEHEVRLKYSKGWGTKKDRYRMCIDCLEKVRAFIESSAR